MVFGGYSLTPILLTQTAWALHSYWYQEQQPYSHWTWRTLALALTLLGPILVVYIAVVHLGWRPSFFAVILGFQALMFAWIAGIIAYHALLPRFRRAA
jgi:hypothetical protein